MSHDKSRSSRHRRSSSSSSSSSVCEEIFIKKTHRKHRDSSSSSSERYNKKKHSRKRSKSSELECYSNDKKRSSSSDKKCKRKRSRSPKRSCSRSPKRSCSRSRSRSRSCSRSSSSERKDKCSFDEIYKYYKYRLVTDETLMVAGSDSYLSGYNNTPSVIPQYYPVYIENHNLNYNIDHINPNSGYFVRTAGVYIVFFVVNAEQSSQFGIYVNGISQGLNRTGNNSGSGQLILRCLLRLKKDDEIRFRNEVSSAVSVQSNLKLGGLLDGNNLTCVITKVGTYDPVSECHFDEKCLSRRKKHLFRKLMDKMLCDNELMLKGFSTHGTVYTTVQQDVATEADVMWDTPNFSNITWNVLSPSNIVINEDGVYKVFFYANVGLPSQMCITLNNVPIDYTIQGTNKGASYISIRTLLELRKGDVLTVRNHTSFNGSITLTAHNGGSELDVSSILTIFKIAPLCKPDHCEVHINKYHRKCFELFKKYLLNQECLQIAGSSAYTSNIGSYQQVVPVGEAYDWPIIVLQNNVNHRQGMKQYTINQDGEYDIFVDTITDEPQQMTLFVNGSPNVATISGRDSGGGRSIMRQFVP